MPYGNPFIIISVLYATSVPLYLKTLPKRLCVLSLALASTTLTLFYLELLRKHLQTPESTEPPCPCRYPSSSVLQFFQQLSIKHRIDFKIANITFHIYSSFFQTCVHPFMPVIPPVPSEFSLSNINLLSVPFVCTSFGASSFSVTAAKIWNYFPLSPYLYQS